MDNNLSQTFFSSSAEDTVAVGCSVGSRIVSGIAIMLTGDLGSGKTTFVKGLACGLGVVDTRYVNSPTYNLINQYSGRFDVYHVDLYRLDNNVDLYELGLREVFDSDGVVVVEWSERINCRDLPIEILTVRFEIVGDFHRRIKVDFCGISLDSWLSS